MQNETVVAYFKVLSLDFFWSGCGKPQEIYV